MDDDGKGFFEMRKCSLLLVADGILLYYAVYYISGE